QNPQSREEPRHQSGDLGSFADRRSSGHLPRLPPLREQPESGIRDPFRRPPPPPQSGQPPPLRRSIFTGVPATVLYDEMKKLMDRGTTQMANEPKASPGLDNLFSTRQIRPEDLPSLGFDIRQPATQLSITREARLNRARALAPVLIGEQRIPVLVLPNPFTEETTGSPQIGHHGVLMYDPQNEDRLVKLFFRDTDWYYAGFQRCVVVERDDGTKLENWGRRFFFNELVEDNEVPAFLEPVKMGIGSSHSEKGDFPGPNALVDTFNTLFTFEDAIHVHENKEVRGLSPGLKNQLKLAVARIIILFSEAMRIRRIFIQAEAALRGYEHSKPLTKAHRDILHSWGKNLECSK
ncbi:hypothetical protein EJB05_36655, partial [Eragrostis curvula]